MKKIYRYMLLAMTAVTMAACGGSNDDPKVDPKPEGPAEGDVALQISTTTIETKAAMTEFKGNDKMNIYAKTYNRIDAPNLVDGVVATFDGSKWSMSPEVYLNAAKTNVTYVYAVAPYDASYTNGQKIPVDLAKQVDLMYSGAYVAASSTSPSVKLKMKHALSLLSFNIIPVNYSGAGNLTMLAIDGEIVFDKGTMDASTGKITNMTQGRVEAPQNKKVQAGGWRSDMPGVWALPFNTKTGVVTLTAVIDGKSYNCIMPEVEVKTGWQYIFRLALTDSGLEFDPSQTETISLNVNSDDPKDFVGYGKVVCVASGTSLSSPVIFGDQVFGTLSTPTNNQAYDGSVLVEGLKAGDKVVVESWNSEGFSVVSLEGIDTIDLSQYE